MPTPSFVVSVMFEVHNEHVESFRTAVLQQAANSLEHEVGCHQFDVCQDNENPNVFVLYETYDDAAAFETHCGTPYFAEFRDTIASWVASKERRLCTIISPPLQS